MGAWRRVAGRWPIAFARAAFALHECSRMSYFFRLSRLSHQGFTDVSAWPTVWPTIGANELVPPPPA